MLFEDTTIDCLINHLKEKNYQILSISDATQHGYDLVAEKDGRKLYIEAKGQTSSKPGTKRYGQEFTSSQKFDHVAKAVLKAMQTLNQESESESGIALPYEPGHIKLIDSILQLLIEYYAVSYDNDRVEDLLIIGVMKRRQSIS